MEHDYIHIHNSSLHCGLGYVPVVYYSLLLCLGLPGKSFAPHPTPQVLELGLKQPEWRNFLASSSPPRHCLDSSRAFSSAPDLCVAGQHQSSHPGFILSSPSSPPATRSARQCTHRVEVQQTMRRLASKKEGEGWV